MKDRVTCIYCHRQFWGNVVPIEINLEYNKKTKEYFVFLRNLKTESESPYFLIKKYLSFESREIIDNSIEIMKEYKLNNMKIKIVLDGLCFKCKNLFRQLKNREKIKPKIIKEIKKSNPKYYLF